MAAWPDANLDYFLFNAQDVGGIQMHKISPTEESLALTNSTAFGNVAINSSIAVIFQSIIFAISEGSNGTIECWWSDASPGAHFNDDNKPKYFLTDSKFVNWIRHDEGLP